MIKRDLTRRDIGKEVVCREGGYTRRGTIKDILPFGQISFLEDGLVNYTSVVSLFWCQWANEADEDEPQPETTGMNLSTAILLMNDKCRVIEGIYCPDTDGDQRYPDGKPKAKRELFKTFDTAIVKDDLLVVPSSTRLKVTTIKVTEVDVEWDPDTQVDIKWIIGRIDMAGFEELKALDDKMFAAIKAAEKTDKRNKLREKLTAHMDEEQKAQLAALSGAVAISHQPTDVETDTTKS